MATSSLRRRASWDVSWSFVLAAWLLLVLLAAAVFLVARRSAGALTTPLLPETQVGCGFGLAALSIGIRTLGGRSDTLSLLRDVWRIAPTAGVVLIALAVSLPGSDSGGLFALWLLVALGEVAAQLIVQARLTIAEPEAAGGLRGPGGVSVDVVRTSPSNFDEPVEEETGVAAEEGEGNVWQRSTRSRDESGQELLAGWLRVDFAPGERTRFAHVTFCPPLARTPNCEVELLDDGTATASVVQVLPQGARFELRLARPAAEHVSIALEWVAYEAEPSEAAGY